MTKNTTLSKRGLELTALPDMRDLFKRIKKDPYDPDENPTGLVNIGVAENFAMIPDMEKYVADNLKLNNNIFTYGDGPWGTERLRTAMARFMEKTMSSAKPVNPKDLMFSNGVTSLCDMLGYTIGDQGDGILLSRPIYQAFQVDFGTIAKVQSVFVSFGNVDPFSPESASKYEEALIEAEKQGTKVRAMMLCNPHNPLGQCYPKDTIIAYMKLCQKYKIHLLSDEIYAASVYDVPDKSALKFTSVLSFDTSPYIDDDYLHVLYGFSKDFASGGLRLGVIYMRNKELNRAMASFAQFHWSGNVNEQIATMVLEDEKWLDNFLETGRQRLASRNKLTRSLLDKAGIQYHRGANAGFFFWIDLRPYLPTEGEFESEWDRETSLMDKLLKGGVFLTNGQGLAAEEPGWFRLIFSQDERTIKEGVKRVCKICGLRTDDAE